MIVGRLTAIRVFASSIAVLLAIALFVTHNKFWMDFLVGMALGLSLGLVAVVWNKNAGDDLSSNDTPVKLNIPR